MSSGYTSGGAGGGAGGTTSGIGGILSSLAAIAQYAIDVVLARAVGLVADGLTYLAGATDSLASSITSLAGTVSGTLMLTGVLFGVLQDLRTALGKVVGALKSLSWGRIWKFLHSIFDKLHRAIKWYKEHILGPIEKMRRQILDVYRKIFRPIIRFLDSLRVATRIIAIFNRRLAARLDAYLWKLEGKILFPITAALHRINGLTSYIAAIITEAGLLDRALLLESLRRDAALVWQVLTNPRALLHEPATPGSSKTMADVQTDVHVFATTGGGEVADYVDQVHQVVQDTIGGIA
jgi:hypothetical protein